MSTDLIPNFAPAAHNLGILTIAELGIPGLLIFTLLGLRWSFMGLGFLWRRRSDPMYRLGVGIFFGICGVYLQSQTEWVYRETDIFMTFHLLIGTLASLYFFKKRARKHKSQAMRPEPAVVLPPPLPQTARVGLTPHAA